MPVPDSAPVAGATLTGGIPPTKNPHRSAPRSRRDLVLVGGLLFVVGLALLVAAAMLGVPTAAKVLLVLAGIGVWVSGVGRLAQAALNRPVDIVFGLAMTWLVLIVAAAILAPVLPLGNHADASAALTEKIFQPPSLFSAHPLGTNGIGLDMLARAVFGARTSLLVALFATCIGTAVGSLIGILAGFFGGVTDSLIGILANALLAIPALILLIALGTVLDPSIRNMAFALALLTIPSMVRLARANTITYSQREFVTAARAIGATKARLMFKELLPNVVPPVLSLAVVMISMLIVAEASLSFLGLGIEPPEPTWGNMIAEASDRILREHPSVAIIPSVFLFLTVFAFNLLGERAQKRWDPRSAKS